MSLTQDFLNSLLRISAGQKEIQRHFDIRLDQSDTKLASVISSLQHISVVVEENNALLKAIVGRPAVKLVFTIELEGQTLKGVTHMIITDSQQFSISVQPVDAKGNAAVVDGPATFESSSPDILSVEPTGDLTALVVAVGPLGSAQIAVTVDADLGEGVRSVSGTLDVEVKGGEAVSLNISTGPVEEQP